MRMMNVSWLLARLSIAALLPAMCTVTPAAAAPLSVSTVVGVLAYTTQKPGGVPSFRCFDDAHGLSGFSAMPDAALQRFFVNVSSVPKPLSLSSSSLTNAVLASTRTWNTEVNDCGKADKSSAALTYAGALMAHTVLPKDDGISVVTFAAGACAATMNVACTWFHTDPETGDLTGWDIVLDPAYPWDYGSPAALDFQSVLTHELGHVLGLQDMFEARNATLTMYGWTWPGDTLKRRLALGDALGIEAASASAAGK